MNSLFNDRSFVIQPLFSSVTTDLLVFKLSKQRADRLQLDQGSTSGKKHFDLFTFIIKDTGFLCYYIPFYFPVNCQHFSISKSVAPYSAATRET